MSVDPNDPNVITPIEPPTPEMPNPSGPASVPPAVPPTLNIPTSEPTPAATPTPLQEMPVVTTPSATPPGTKSGSKKGLIITGILGLSAVAILGVLSFSIKNATKDATTPSQAVTETTPTPTPQQILNLSFTNLKDGDVSSTKILKVTGSTGVKATVSVVGGSEDIVFETDGPAFSVDIPLTLGANKLVFTAQDQNDNQVTETRNVLYSEDLPQ